MAPLHDWPSGAHFTQGECRKESGRNVLSGGGGKRGTACPPQSGVASRFGMSRSVGQGRFGWKTYCLQNPVPYFHTFRNIPSVSRTRESVSTDPELHSLSNGDFAVEITGPRMRNPRLRLPARLDVRRMIVPSDGGGANLEKRRLSSVKHPATGRRRSSLSASTV